MKRRWRGLWVPVFIHQLAKGLHGLGGFFGEVYIFISLVCHANNPVGMLGIHNGNIVICSASFVPETGEFDTATQTALEAWQIANNITPLGVVDDSVWKQLKAGANIS